jgi:hypothetical protein
MSEHDANLINRLIGKFTDLQENWDNHPQDFNWSPLQTLANEGAHAYNEGCGPSFHALALDGVWHGEFHERFLGYSLQADFDPFKLARAGSGTTEIPVIDHATLAEAALSNPSSARMRAALMEVARERFSSLAQEIQRGKPKSSLWLYRVAEACAESIPLDLLEQIEPELAARHPGEVRQQSVDPVEGYLSSAELIVDSSSKPYG